MGVFKLDLMTILVLFVVLSVIFTMTSGAKENKQVSPATAVQKPLVQGLNNVKAAEYSTINYSSMSPAVNNSRLSGRTWN